MHRNCGGTNMKAIITFALAWILCSALVTAQPGRDPKSKEGEPSTTIPSSPSASIPPLPQTYQIGIEDVLRVSVWREPELTVSVPVRTDGKISIPLLNDVQAAGLTPLELSMSITQGLKRYLDDPRVTVVVTQMRAHKVYMLGEVMHHGPLALTPDMTIMQALATCGLTPFANTKKIYILRVVNGTQQKFPVNYKQMIKGKAVEQNIVLKPDDTIVVP
jgi:polysaccharide biosynthesis/export protein